MATVREVRWRNIGGWLRPWGFHPSIGILTPWGNLILKLWRDRLFSERYGPMHPLKVGPFCISWVWLRKSASQD